MPPWVLYYSLMCAVVGLMGLHRKLGFWGYFLCSIMLTPMIGLILVLVSDPRRARDFD